MSSKYVDKLLMYYPDWEFTLYEKEYVVVTGELGEVDKFKPYVKLKLYINKYSGYHFSLCIPNHSYNYRNPFKCIKLGLKQLVTRELKLERRLGE